MGTLGHVGSAGWVEMFALVVAGLVAVSLRRRHGRLLAWAAVAALGVSVYSPVGAWAQAGVTGHMVQHLIILLAAAPLMGTAMSIGLPVMVRSLRGFLSAVVWSRKAPLVAGGCHATVLALWHLPVAYDAALRSDVIHSLEHATMFVTGVWWWGSIVHHSRRRSIGPAVVSVFGVAVVGAVIGILLMFSSRAMYAHGDVLDQQIAGALMAGVMGACLGVAAAAAMVAGLGRVGPDLVRVRAFRHVRAVLMVSASALALTVVSAQPATAVEGASPDLEKGVTLYQRDCSSCHGPAGEGSRRGPSLAGAGEAANFYYLHTGRMPIASVDSAIERSRPAYTSSQLSELVAYAATLGDGPALPPLPDGTADVVAGGIHYRLHCASCHGAGGAGGALTVDEFAPSLHLATMADILAAVVSGPGTMPSFEGVLDEDAMADVGAYVAHLRDPPRTGIPLPGGRVGEGLAAVVAFAALAVAARLLGEAS